MRSNAPTLHMDVKKKEEKKKIARELSTWSWQTKDVAHNLLVSLSFQLSDGPGVLALSQNACNIRGCANSSVPPQGHLSGAAEYADHLSHPECPADTRNLVETTTTARPARSRTTMSGP